MKDQERFIEQYFKTHPCQKVHLPTILSWNIAQYGRAIHTLRHRKEDQMCIVNRGERVNGSLHTWFIYYPGVPYDPDYEPPEFATMNNGQLSFAGTA